MLTIVRKAPNNERDVSACRRPEKAAASTGPASFVSRILILIRSPAEKCGSDVEISVMHTMRAEAATRVKDVRKDGIDPE